LLTSLWLKAILGNDEGKPVTDLPDNIDLQWVGRHLVDFRDETREAIAGLRRDMDMTIRLVARMDNTLNALREDVRDLWLAERDLRRRVETIEDARR
jgi:hypothetical protein